MQRPPLHLRDLHVRHLFAALLVLAVVALTVGFSRAVPVGAAPAAQRHAQAVISPHEIIKITLGDSSVAAPAIAGLSAAFDQSPSPNAANMVMAWAGTNSDHNLTVEQSSNGLEFSHKVALPATSQYRPAVLLVRQGNANVVILGWTNTSTNQQIHILYDVYNTTGHQQQIALPEKSNDGPSLTLANGQVWIAWTDTNHTLNVESLGAQGLTPGQKTTLQQFSASSGPTLITAAMDHVLEMTWAGTDSNSTLHIATSQDGHSWSQLSPAPAPQQSIGAPALLALEPFAVPRATPFYYWAWTGTDSHHTIALTYAARNEYLSNPVTTFDETSIGAPGLAFVGESGQFVLVWTGTDPEHLLNTAIIQATKQVGTGQLP